jgi:hypothetical protein
MIVPPHAKPDGLHPHVSSTLRATLEGTIPAGVTDDADDGGSIRGQVVSQAATDPLSYTPVKTNATLPTNHRHLHHFRW